MKLRSIKSAPLQDKRVLLRVDFNVPQKSDHTIADDTRIKEALPTIKYLLDQRCSLVIISHLGRPDGKVNHKYSLQHVAKRLSEYIKKEVIIASDFTSDEAIKRVKKLPIGAVVMCENIRFHPGEEQNDPNFSKQMALLGDVYVNDAFAVSHRAHASLVGITKFLPSYIGLLFAKEIKMIHQAITKPKRPLLVIIGGGKTPEKIRVIEKLLDNADTIYLGGAIANTFFATWGIGVGVSKVDHEMIEMCRSVFWKATQVPCRLLLPKDVVVSNKNKTLKPTVVPYTKVTQELGIYDIGPKSLNELRSYAKEAKTIIWNGPMGLYEDERFDKGTRKTFDLVAKSRAETLIGGGDTISVVKDKALLRKISHISTGGGAMLEFMEKGTLPALEALKV